MHGSHHLCSKVHAQAQNRRHNKSLLGNLSKICAPLPILLLPAIHPVGAMAPETQRSLQHCTNQHHQSSTLRRKQVKFAEHCPGRKLARLTSKSAVADSGLAGESRTTATCISVLCYLPDRHSHACQFPANLLTMLRIKEKEQNFQDNSIPA